MSARIAVRNAKRRRRIITAGWVLGLTLITVILIYRELTALLYVMATLGVAALLVVVAFSDISQREESPSQSSLPTQPPMSPAAGIGKTDWGSKKRR